jgi:hypothetical protein
MRHIQPVFAPFKRAGIEGLMRLYAPNTALFVIAGCLALMGVLASLPISLPIPGLTANPAWYIFLAWFLLAAGSVVGPRSKTDEN